MCMLHLEPGGSGGLRRKLKAQVYLWYTVSPVAPTWDGRRTLQSYVLVWVLFYRLDVILLVVIVLLLNNIAVGVIPWRVALKDVSGVAGVFNPLGYISYLLGQVGVRKCKGRTFL